MSRFFQTNKAQKINYAFQAPTELMLGAAEAQAQRNAIADLFARSTSDLNQGQTFSGLQDALNQQFDENNRLINEITEKAANDKDYLQSQDYINDLVTARENIKEQFNTGFVGRATSEYKRTAEWAKRQAERTKEDGTPAVDLSMLNRFYSKLSSQQTADSWADTYNNTGAFPTLDLPEIPDTPDLVKSFEEVLGKDFLEKGMETVSGKIMPMIATGNTDPKTGKPEYVPVTPGMIEKYGQELVENAIWESQGYSYVKNTETHTYHRTDDLMAAYQSHVLSNPEVQAYVNFIKQNMPEDGGNFIQRIKEAGNVIFNKYNIHNVTKDQEREDNNAALARLRFGLQRSARIEQFRINEKAGAYNSSIEYNPLKLAGVDGAPTLEKVNNEIRRFDNDLTNLSAELSKLIEEGEGNSNTANQVRKEMDQINAQRTSYQSVLKEVITNMAPSLDNDLVQLLTESINTNGHLPADFESNIQANIEKLRGELVGPKSQRYDPGLGGYVSDYSDQDQKHNQQIQAQIARQQELLNQFGTIREKGDQMIKDRFDNATANAPVVSFIGPKAQEYLKGVVTNGYTVTSIANKDGSVVDYGTEPPSAIISKLEAAGMLGQISLSSPAMGGGYFVLEVKEPPMSETERLMASASDRSADKRQSSYPLQPGTYLLGGADWGSVAPLLEHADYTYNDKDEVVRTTASQEVHSAIKSYEQQERNNFINKTPVIGHPIINDRNIRAYGNTLRVYDMEKTFVEKDPETGTPLITTTRVPVIFFGAKNLEGKGSIRFKYGRYEDQIGANGKVTREIVVDDPDEEGYFVEDETKGRGVAYDYFQ